MTVAMAVLHLSGQEHDNTTAGNDFEMELVSLYINYCSLYVVQSEHKVEVNADLIKYGPSRGNS